MKALLLSTLVLISFQAAHAGSAQTILSCKSVEGDLSLKGYVPGDSAEYDITLKYGKNESRLYSITNCNLTGCTVDENGSLSVVEALKKGVYTVSASRGGETVSDIKLYALPKTVVIKNISNGTHSSFGGVLTIYDQALGLGWTQKNILCTTDYAI
jgi:hypothetical protein